MESRRDGRVVFVMPWKGQTLVGTTETRFTGNADDAVALQSEKSYLASILTHHFPRYGEAIAAGKIESFAGLRVLPTGEGHAFHRSREVILDTDRETRAAYAECLRRQAYNLEDHRQENHPQAETDRCRIARVADTGEIRLDPGD